ncbi:MAG: hypothetical protein ACL9RN_04275 [Cylindrospermopsis raciborskii]|nr:hypothetical protein [Cylindrospermopsis raciborskii]
MQNRVGRETPNSNNTTLMQPSPNQGKLNSLELMALPDLVC